MWLTHRVFVNVRVKLSHALLPWCETPKQHYFYATEIEGSDFPRFLIPLGEILLLVVWLNCPNRLLFGPKLTELYNLEFPFGPMMPSYIPNIVILLYNHGYHIEFKEPLYSSPMKTPRDTVTPESLSFRCSLKCKLNAYFQPKIKWHWNENLNSKFRLCQKKDWKQFFFFFFRSWWKKNLNLAFQSRWNIHLKFIIRLRFRKCRDPLIQISKKTIKKVLISILYYTTPKVKGTL